MKRVFISPADVRKRIDQLDTIRLERHLTDAECAEADALARRLYMRQWRAIERERERERTLKQRVRAAR